MISYDNSLKEIISILLKIGKWMQQGSDLLSPLFISNFHWRREQNRARYNKAPRIAALAANWSSPLATRALAVACANKALSALRSFPATRRAAFLRNSPTASSVVIAFVTQLPMFLPTVTIPISLRTPSGVIGHLECHIGTTDLATF